MLVESTTNDPAQVKQINRKQNRRCLAPKSWVISYCLHINEVIIPYVQLYDQQKEVLIAQESEKFKDLGLEYISEETSSDDDTITV